MRKGTKKVISILLSLAMLLSIASFSAFAQERAEVPMGEEAQAHIRGQEPVAPAAAPRRTSGARLMEVADQETGVASLTLGGDVTYYDTLQSALDAAKEAYTAEPTVIPVVDLLQDVQECVEIGYDPRLDQEPYTPGYSNYKDSELVLNLNGHTMDGGSTEYFGTGDQDHDVSVITVHYATTLTLNGAGPDGQRGRITGGYSAVGGGIFIGNVNCGRKGIIPLPEGSKGADVTIRDLEVSDNYAWSEGTSIHGGGGIALASYQYVARNHLSLDNVLIANNISENEGGGLFCFRGEVEMTNSEVIYNQAGNRGGGMDFYENSTCRIENCKINNNTVNVGTEHPEIAGVGGGICLESQVIGEIINSEIKDNTAERGGGGIASLGGFDPGSAESPDPDPKPEGWEYDLSLVNTTVTGNKALFGGGIDGDFFITMKITQGCVISNNTADGDGGGGVFLKNYSTLEIADSEVNNNSASYGGGVYLYQDEYPYGEGTVTATVTNSTINGNTVTGNGGGVCCDYDSSLTAISSEINENTTTSGGGGGICAYYGTVTLKDSSVQKNKAETNVGGGIATWPGTITVDKSVIANNTSGYGADDIYTAADYNDSTAKSSLTIDRAYFDGAMLESDNTPISGWYKDYSDPNRWSETYCKLAISAGETALTTSASLWLKAAHGFPTYDIDYDLQGGSLGKDDEGNDVTNLVKYEAQTPTFTLNNPSKTGYTFAGWTGGVVGEADEVTNADTVTIEKGSTGNRKYTANWTPNQYGYTVEYYYNGVKDAGKTVITNADFGTAINDYEAKADAGYKLDKTENLPLTIGLDEAANVIKVYYVTDETQTKELSYTVEYYKDGVKADADTQTVTQTVQVLAANTLTVVKDAINTVDKYVGYTLKETDPATIPDTVDTGATIKVYYEANDYTITYDLAGGATTSEQTSFTQHYGDKTATIAEPTKAGYTFGGWTPAVAETVTDNATYTAQWTAIDYTVTYDLAGGETTSEETVFTQHYGDKTPTINEPTRSGHNFTGWTPAVAETVTESVTYTAQWERRSGGGGYRPSPSPSPSPNPPEEDLDDPDVPLANLPTLNTEDHVAYLIGRPDGTIAPMDNITRGEVATIFFRLLSEESRSANWSTSCGYVDMDGSEYFYNPVSTATKAGLIKGYDDGTFGGGRKITRAEMATIAARFLSDGDSGEDLFTDIAGHWAQRDINRAAKAGWFKTTDDNGNAVGSFRPDDYITRAEVVVMINRMLGRKANKDYLLPNMKVWPDNVDSQQTAWYYLDIQEATNSHDYTRAGIGQPETWVELIDTPDWAAMERR